MAELIAVTKAQAGFAPSLRYALARAMGAKPCPMKALSHGLIRPTSAWEALADRFATAQKTPLPRQAVAASPAC